MMPPLVREADVKVRHAPLWWVAHVVSALNAGAGLYLFLFVSPWLGLVAFALAAILSYLADRAYVVSL